MRVSKQLIEVGSMFQEIEIGGLHDTEQKKTIILRGGRLLFKS